MTNYEVSALKKGLEILDLLKISRYSTLTGISKTLELNKTTTFRLLKTLENMNYVKRRDNYYELSSAKFLLDDERKTSIDWSTLQSLYRFGVDLQKNVYIGTLEGTDLVVKQVINHNSEKSASHEMGNRSPPHQSALGKVIMANLKQDELKSIVSLLSFTKATDHTFVDQDLFFHHLEVIKKQGFAIDYEELYLDVHCIAAPVFQNNKVVAAFAIADLNERMKKTHLRSLTRKVTEASKEITNEISSYLYD